jgi:hypothetical protein
MATPELAGSAAVARAGTGRVRARVALERWAPAAAVFGLSLAGIVIRLIVVHQGLFGDELSTYWIVVGHSLNQVLALLYGAASIHHEEIHHAEITPPLYFVAAWLTTRVGHSAELLRLPSLLAGSLTVPLVYRLGLRTVGRGAALIGCALTALSPFMIYYSTEARAYAVMMLLVVVSTLALLLAVDQRRTRWWVVYGASSCLAVYTHYTCVFPLIAQLAWALWVHPEARRPAILANLGAMVALLPWIGGLINDLTSPTVTILSALSPFTLHDIPRILAHWAIGYPYANYGAGVAELPGPAGLALLALATLLALGTLTARAMRSTSGHRVEAVAEWLGGRDRRLLLVALLALATPVGEAIVSTFSTHIFGVRNLAASWPALALAFAALLSAGPRWASLTAGALAVAAFAIGAALMLTAPYARPDYPAAGAFVARHLGREGGVIDETGEISPGPVTPLDTTLARTVQTFRAGSPAERTHPFGFADPVVPLAAAIRQAVAAVRGGHVLLVSNLIPAGAQVAQRRQPVNPSFPPPYRLTDKRVYPGIVATEVRIYAAHP